MFHKTGGNMEGAGSAPNKDKPTVPEGTTYVWTPAIERPVINGLWNRRAHYKQVDGSWQSYSNTNEGWFKSYNDKTWFDKETEEGYFVSIETFRHPDFVIKPEKV